MKEKKKFLLPFGVFTWIEFLITIFFIVILVISIKNKNDWYFILIYSVITAYSIFDNIVTMINYNITYTNEYISMEGEKLFVSKKEKVQFSTKVLLKDVKSYKIIQTKDNSKGEGYGSTSIKKFLEVIDNKNASYRFYLNNHFKTQTNKLLDHIYEVTKIEQTK